MQDKVDKVDYEELDQLFEPYLRNRHNKIPEEEHVAIDMLLKLCLLCCSPTYEKKYLDLLLWWVADYAFEGSGDARKLCYGLQKLVIEGATPKNIRTFEHYTHTFFRLYPDEEYNRNTLLVYLVYYVIYFRKKSIWSWLSSKLTLKSITLLVESIRDRLGSNDCIDRSVLSFITILIEYINLRDTQDRNKYQEYCVHKSLSDCLRSFITKVVTKSQTA